jgi:hypothetical protein
VSQLSGKAIAAINHLAINHNARANACTESDNNKVFHATSNAVCHLSDSSCIGIIGQSYGNA